MRTTQIAVVLSLAYGAWALSAAGADAAVIYDNLNFPTTFSDSVRAVNPNNGNPSDGPLADSFSVTSSLLLTDVTVRVELESTNTSPTRSVTVALLRDNNTHPGGLIAVLGTITDSQLPLPIRTPIDITLSPASAVPLAPGRYWIHLSTSDNSRAGWAAAGGDNSGSTYGTGPTEFGIGGEGEYFYAGGALALGYPTDVFPNGPSPYLPYQMRVEGEFAPVPEPASLALLSVGLGALGLIRCRRRAADLALG